MAPYLASLGLTLAVEIPIYVGLLGLGAGVSGRRALVAAVLVNLVSHPLFSAVLVPVADRLLPDVAALVAGELAVCALEAALLLRFLPVTRAVAVAASLVANGASFGVGLVVLEGVRL